MKVSGNLHALAAVSPRKDVQYSLYRMLGEPHSWSCHCGKEKHPALLGIELQLSFGQVILLTELAQQPVRAEETDFFSVLDFRVCS
jgi:hypothetical protein